MKIEIKKRGDKSYYNELLYVCFKLDNIRKNPNQKVHQLTNYLLLCSLGILLGIIMFILFYLDDKKIVYIFLTGMLAVILLMVIIYFILVNKRIKTFISDVTEKTFSIDEMGITLSDEEKNIIIKWDNLEKIIINKYSIVFLPKENNKVLISTSTIYKDEIIKSLDKYQKTSSIVDNSEKYRN